MEIIAGIDSGATSTKIMLVNLEGKVLIYSEGPPANPFVVGNEFAAKILIKALRKSVLQIGKLKDVKAVTFGLTGYNPVLENLIKKNCKIEKIMILDDQIITLEGALLKKPGVVVYSGTGSFAIGKNSQNEIARASGKGFLLSDEGSGFYIGQEALRAALKGFDGRGKKTLLTKYVLDYYKVKDFYELWYTLHSKPLITSNIAKLAPLVFKAAKKKDLVSLQIIESATKELTLMAKAVSIKLGLINEYFPVSFSGNVFKSNLFKEFFFKNLVSEIPNAYVIRPAFPPVVGSVIFGFKCLGLNISNKILNTIKKTMKEEIVKL
ncbi:MAG: BadF/BadG/BcrA/BcrD ATPase family protein [Candidatus Methanomethylicaceae archaeon]